MVWKFRWPYTKKNFKSFSLNYQNFFLTVRRWIYSSSAVCIFMSLTLRSLRHFKQVFPGPPRSNYNFLRFLFFIRTAEKTLWRGRGLVPAHSGGKGRKNGKNSVWPIRKLFMRMRCSGICFRGRRIRIWKKKLNFEKPKMRLGGGQISNLSKLEFCVSFSTF